MENKLISSRQATVGIIGLGYVGLPLILQFGKAGFSTVGLDVDPGKIDRLIQGTSYIKHICSEDIQTLNDNGKAQWTSDFSIVSELDFILICVPTPLNSNREPDLGYIISTAKQIAPYLVKGKNKPLY